MQNGKAMGYEYRQVTVKESVAAKYTNAYKSFGWKLEERTSNPSSAERVVLKFKRDCNIRNKAELTRLQRNFEACMDEIAELEHSARRRAAAAAYGAGAAGLILTIGSVICVTAKKNGLYTLLLLPAFVLWGLSYTIYKYMVKKRNEKITPLIDQKQKEISMVCGKASTLVEQTEM